MICDNKLLCRVYTYEIAFVISQSRESNSSFVMEDKSNRCFKHMKTLIILERLSKLYAKASIGYNKKDH